MVPQPAPTRAHLVNGDGFIPGFAIEKLVGKGGMGAVYKARKLNIGKTVALKVLFPTLGEDPIYSARFEREVRSLALLTHPRLVNVLDAGRHGALHYMVMDFVEGANLDAVVAERGPIRVAELRAIAEQVLEALCFVHAQGMVHRDLKPANLILAPDGSVKVCDLGMVGVGGEASELTQKLLLGTPEFISPEQARGDRDLDIRSDLYALGATLYFLASGRPPFRGETPMQTAQQHLHAPVPPLRRLRPDLPAHLGRFVHRLLSKRAERRFQDPAQALAALRGPVRTVAPAGFWAGAALALVALAAALWMLHGGPKPAVGAPAATESAAPLQAPEPPVVAPSRGAELVSDLEALQGELSEMLQSMAGADPAQRQALLRRLETLEQSLDALDHMAERFLRDGSAGR